MGKRTDIKKILIIGAGPIVIGQGCEFDYSGTQACKALKEEGYTVILVNSNPATIMTDPSMADHTYIEPLTVKSLKKIIAKEKPCAILPTVGGQTGLNLGLDLAKEGILKKYDVEMIGAKPEVIEKAEGRHLFKKAMQNIGLSLPNSETANTCEEAKEKAKKIGYPIIVRPAFTLGGTGGGIAENEKDLLAIVEQGLMNSLISEVLIEESIIGWKEYELEVMRDKNDNVIIICSIENIDAMGVHTGDSITVAPAQTLTDKEYQNMRNAAIKIMREIGVDTGGSNVQFAVNPKNGKLVVIEMNPRVSRSSALASKATGFPIAKLAAKLSVGFTLDELKNDITKKTPACFEPALDYCVVKIPRFDTKKFSKQNVKLGTSMKSVGEAMSIGRTFKEAFQKGIRSLELGQLGFGYDGQDLKEVSPQHLERALKTPTANRMLYVKYALEINWDLKKIHQLSGIDPWFLNQFKQITDMAKNLKELNKETFLTYKKAGFSDHQLATITNEKNQLIIRKKRLELGVKPTYSLVDTCAAEFEAYTPYFYSTYETEDEQRKSVKNKVLILGGGPNRIGQGIEFDYCCVHASFSLRENNFESIMVNSNPETVSTDFDISDKLYFEPLTLEDILNIYDAENPLGVIIQFGGQTPLNLSQKLEEAGVNVLGTSPKSINDCEDREKTKQLLKKCGLKQPENGTATNLNEALKLAKSINYPLVVRPSFVIGGTSMKIVYDNQELEVYMKTTTEISKDRPVLLDRYLENATEIDVDCLSDKNESLIIGLLQHIEPAGIHSGDSACVFPPYSINSNLQEKMRNAGKKLAKELNVIGLLNIQFAIKNEELYVIEVNPRASRTVPFICKATGVPWIKIATSIIMGKTIQELKLKEVIPPYYSVKEAVFPFTKFEETDILLGPEMKSTGEVMGIDSSFGNAFLKSQLATNQFSDQLPRNIFITIDNKNKKKVVEDVKRLHKNGVKFYATKGTKDFLEKKGIKSQLVTKISENIKNSSLDIIKNKKVDLVFNTPEKAEDKDEIIMRRATLMYQIPFITNIETFAVFTNAILNKSKELNVKSIQEYYSEIKNNI